MPFHRYSVHLATSPQVPGNWLAATSHSWEHFGAAVAVVLILLGMRRVRDGMDGITTVWCPPRSVGNEPSPFPSAADWLGTDNSASQPFGASKKFQGMDKMCHNRPRMQDHPTNTTHQSGVSGDRTKSGWGGGVTPREFQMETWKRDEGWEGREFQPWLSIQRKKKVEWDLNPVFWYGLRSL